MVNPNLLQNRFKGGILGFIFILFLIQGIVFAQGNEYVQDSRELNPLESAANRTGDFLWSIIGAIAGFVLFFIVAPFIMFKSEFQYLLENFSKAKIVDPKVKQEGFIAIFGKSKVKKPEMMSKTPLLYQSYIKEKLEITTKIVCGSDAEKENVEKISPAPDKCRKVIVSENGKDIEKTVCEKCFNAKVREWKEVERYLKTPELSIESYQVKPNEKTLYKGEIQSKENKINEKGNEYREKIEYIVADEKEILAVGNAKNGEINSGNPFVISTKNFGETREIIANEQKTWVLILKVLGFLAFAIGMYLILAPIPALINIFGSIPFIGGIFGGLSGVTGFLVLIVAVISAIVMSIVLTIVFKIARAVTDNIFVIIGLTVIIGLVLMFVFGKIF